MPMPTVLPQLDWAAIFESAMEHADWLAAGKIEMNHEAMEILSNELQLDPQVVAHLTALDSTVHVIAIAEDWCPDVIRHVPILEKMKGHSKNLKVRYVMREDHPDVLARHLTSGGEAVPKFIFFNHEFVECGEWGPMPQLCREMIQRGRAAGDIAKARENVAAMYNADPQRRMVVNEFLSLIDIASCKVP